MIKQLKILNAIFLTVLLFSCDDSKNLQNKNESYNSIFQSSSGHCGLGSDSVVITRNNENELYNGIHIYRGHNLIFDYTQNNLEIIGSPFVLFTEQEFISCQAYYYIFTLLGAPGPNSFLVIKTSLDTTYIFGQTHSSTAEIFGDVDYDGKFEIGGFEWYCEADDSTCHPKDLYSVFEIDTGFPVDTTLTEYFKRFLKD